MQILPFHFSRSPVVAGALCLALATVIAGCASKNPLMEEPTPVASKKKVEPVKQAESAPAPVAAEEKSADTATAVAPAEATSQAASIAPPKAEEPAAVVSAPAPAAAETGAADVKEAPATPVAATESAPSVTAPAAAAATTGVQTVREKRFLGFFRPYRPDIQQGNFVSREMVAQLKPGMTQDQVIFLLGTPLLSDIFHAERWDYAFRLQKGNGELTTSRVTVFFKDKLVSSFEGGGDLPTEADYLARIANKAKEKK
jgi:outer membrane protein assembly factor BamE